jgi:protein O-mannosyl-transferase
VRITIKTLISSEKNILILCFLVVGLCYANSLPNDFVGDDFPIVAANPAIRSIAPIHFLKSPYWTESQSAGIYRPLTVLSLSIDYAIWHRWPAGFRLMNLLIHALNGWLLFLIARSIVGPGTVAIAAALIYVMHPVHTEAVTTIVGRGELLGVCFFLAAWLLFRRGRTGWAVALFVLSVLSKENAIVLPAVLVLDIFFSNGCDLNKVTAAWKKLVAIGFAALAYLGLRFWVLGGLGVPAVMQYRGGTLSYLERWMTSGRVFLRYLQLVLAPIDLVGDYDVNTIPIAHPGDWDAWIGILLVVLTISVAVWFRRRDWAISLGLFFAITALIPASNWIMPISVLMAERFLYLPMIGLALAAAVMFARLPSRFRTVTGAGWLTMALVLCIAHNYIWRNEFTYYRNMVRVEPENVKARIGYGFALIQAGYKEEAADQLQAGLRILPNNPSVISTLALTKMTRKSCSDAWPLLERALAISPNHGDTLRRVADCYLREGRIPEAEAAYRRAADHIPFPDSLFFLTWALSLENTGQKRAAITAYERAALIDPQNVLVRQKLAALNLPSNTRGTQ